MKPGVTLELGRVADRSTEPPTAAPSPAPCSSSTARSSSATRAPPISRLRSSAGKWTRCMSPTRRQISMSGPARTTRDRDHGAQQVAVLPRHADDLRIWCKLTPEQEWWFDFRSTLDALGRVLVTTPGVPPGPRSPFLQDAVGKLVKNPEARWPKPRSRSATSSIAIPQAARSRRSSASSTRQTSGATRPRSSTSCCNRYSGAAAEPRWQATSFACSPRTNADRPVCRSRLSRSAARIARTSANAWSTSLLMTT